MNPLKKLNDIRNYHGKKFAFFASDGNAVGAEKHYRYIAAIELAMFSISESYEIRDPS